MKKKIVKVIRILLLIICITVMAISGWYLYKYLREQKEAQDVVDDLKDMIVEIPEDEDELLEWKKMNSDINIYQELYEKNNDFIGWITIEGTKIDYPVMQTPNDEQYYLYKDFNKNYLVSGTLFCKAEADIEKPSDNILIYGHHMSGGKLMFADLEKYMDEEFYKKHKYIKFGTIYDNYGKYEIIAAFRTDVNVGTYEYYNFIDGTEEEFNEYVNNAKSHTPYNIETSAEYGDKLISLSTCAYHTNNGRLVIVAKKIQ